MNTQKLISLTASILITAASVATLVGVCHDHPPHAATATLRGMPITDLPGMVVRPNAATVPVKRSVAAKGAV